VIANLMKQEEQKEDFVSYLDMKLTKALRIWKPSETRGEKATVSIDPVRSHHPTQTRPLPLPHYHWECWRRGSSWRCGIGKAGRGATAASGGAAAAEVQGGRQASYHGATRCLRRSVRPEHPRAH
jgi:hypothetical protein